MMKFFNKIYEYYKKFKYSFYKNPYAPYLTTEEYISYDWANNYNSEFSIHIDRNRNDFNIKCNNRYQLNDGESYKLYIVKANTNVWDIHIDIANMAFRSENKILRFNGKLSNVIDYIKNTKISEIERKNIYPVIVKYDIDRLNIKKEEIEQIFTIFKDLNESAIFSYGFIQHHRYPSIENVPDVSFLDVDYLMIGQRNEYSNKIGFVIHTSDSMEVMNEIVHMKENLEALYPPGYLIYVNEKKKNTHGKNNNIDIVVYKGYKSRYDKEF